MGQVAQSITTAKNTHFKQDLWQATVPAQGVSTWQPFIKSGLPSGLKYKYNLFFLSQTVLNPTADVFPQPSVVALHQQTFSGKGTKPPLPLSRLPAGQIPLGLNVPVAQPPHSPA